MNKTKLALVAVALTSLAPFVQAEEPASDWSISGNAGLFSDYRFRGISQTDKKPAFQGGFDIAHSSGFYIGNWNSNIDSRFFADSNLEMDVYGGFRNSLGDFGYDFGVLTYIYPGSKPKIDNTEIYLGVSYGPVSAKYYYAVSDFFGFDNSDGSGYLDVAGSYDIGGGFSLVGHVGYQKLKGSAKVTEIGASSTKDSVTDWKIGVNYTLPNDWTLGLAYIDTDRDLAGGGSPNRNISDSTAVLSLSASF